MARQVQTSDSDKTLIKQIMRDKGISVAELAERMGKAQPTISNLLVKQNMTIDTLSNFAEALGVEIADLIPVKPGYVHYSEKRKRFLDNMEGVATPQPSPLSDTTIKLPTEQQPMQTTAFCPHCGAKVRVGVVLLPE